MKDRAFDFLLALAGVFILLLTGGIVYALVSESLAAFGSFGFFGFIGGTEWSDHSGAYGALPFIAGTLLTSILALVICVPFSMAVALFDGEYYRGTKVAKTLGIVVDLLAGVPSIVYGLWGFYTLAPILKAAGVNGTGFGVLLASFVLAIMIIPYASSLSTEFISMVPNDLKESAYSLGATKSETILSISLPVAGSGIFASYILAFGRALGETMAVTMLIGNTNVLPTSLSSAGNTMASVIANQFGEAIGLKLSALFAIALLLFLITAVINFLAKLIIKRLSGK